MDAFDKRYNLGQACFEDGLSVVYKALDQQTSQSVLIKRFKDKTRQRPMEALLRFHREIERVSRIQHPNILKVLSRFEHEGLECVICEFFEGAPVSVAAQALSVDEAVDIITQAALALDAAHQAGMMHGRINLSALWVGSDAAKRTVKLANFGESLLLSLADISEKAEIIDTFGYLSPEQSGILRRPIDYRSDIYSLGVVFYQLVTGRLPYLGEEVDTLIHQHIAQKPAAPEALDARIPAVIGRIILRLIAKDPQER